MVGKAATPEIIRRTGLAALRKSHNKQLISAKKWMERLFIA
jgi:hypothetical protein